MMLIGHLSTNRSIEINEYISCYIYNKNHNVVFVHWCELENGLSNLDYVLPNFKKNRYVHLDNNIMMKFNAMNRGKLTANYR